MYYKTTYSSPVGLLTLASDGNALIGIWIDGQKYHGETIFETMETQEELKIFYDTKKWLEDYFDGKNPPIHKLDFHFLGTDFQRMVWKILCEIPYGEVTTYGEIAKKIALLKEIDSMSSQAVGGAVGHNPLSIVVPCHRVIGTNGSLTGYAGGLETKITLLTLEGINTKRYTIPKKGSAL